ncbi:AAA domain-containing protein [Coprobacter tertius]|uniref:AAA domain-containing protein n=1 Tax=Coprobacter tertius TaxID=2944915 RepID=A0ABT1MFG9_9BACT|nr:AAA domain-containing protein [Coprobacter tertius]MCP9611374.1 AAA domain-containing protein [Coprobacter tertius]
MIDTSKNFILIDGENRTSQIENIYREGQEWYRVKFNNSYKTYRYSSDKILCLTDPESIDIGQNRIFIDDRLILDLKEVLAFRHKSRVYWHVVHTNGYTRDLIDGQLVVKASCLSDRKSGKVFEYLKSVAATNILGKEEGKSENGLLYKLYRGIDFIDNQMAVAPYLNPGKKIKSYKSSDLIFPFGCNASQKKAVVCAFKNQISVIQGPPGTGKTQTILNIIANILLKKQTVLVVSNNNSATTNVLDKLDKSGLGFIVAPLGKKENKEAFIANQPPLPKELLHWKLNTWDKGKNRKGISDALSRLDKIYAIQEKLALSKQELKEVELEWNHFRNEQNTDFSSYDLSKNLKSSYILDLWLQFQAYAENDSISPDGWVQKILAAIKWWWMNRIGKYRLRLKSKFDKFNLQAIITELQALYYLRKIDELNKLITDLMAELKMYDAKAESGRLTDLSMQLFRAALYDKYGKTNRHVFSSLDDLRTRSGILKEQYPVVLSTTFSSRLCLPENDAFDYLIMDEASQVSVETGALALTCARNAVIVGDTLQIPNVVTEEDKIKLNVIAERYDIPPGYNCADNSFLQSVCDILPDVPQTLLREHYRCHPRIINFCNQKFYGGSLLIMTEEDDKPDTMRAVLTSPGNHARSHYNQREIDVIKNEVLPGLPSRDDVGIITPYNAQVEQLSRQLPDFEAATVHKFQGREKDTIIMSVVDNQITPFSDDPNLLNVAVSRAKDRFCLVVSGNEQELKGNITELMSYIAYNNFTVTESKIHSVFDYLYSQYTRQRFSFIRGHAKVSEYDSENLTFALIQKILEKHREFHHLSVVCHVPLRNIIKDNSLLSEDEKNYVSNYRTHVDFLLINRVSKMPVLGIETDGYFYHNCETQQHLRDKMKDHIFQLYRIPLLRLSTVGSGEENKIVDSLASQIPAGVIS